ncbi:MAG: hypothetical protein WC568_01860 [Candidatus Methanoperedens sp.]
MGFPGTEAGLLADMTLVAQTAGFLAIFLGYIYARKKNFLKHDITAKIAVLLGGLSFVWMGFSLVSNFLPLISMTFMGLLIVSHAITGLLALFMGIFLVFNEIKKTKTPMRVVFLLWAAAMFLGVIVYIVLYSTIF